MNDTKWDEVFRAFFENECRAGDSLPVFYRTKGINGYVSDWDCSWEHFGSLFPWYQDLEWLQIALTADNSTFVVDTLKSIHVPGSIDEKTATIFGYKQDCDYI